MSTRPARQTRLPAKYKENADETVLTSHRSTVTSGLVQVPSPSPVSDPSGPSVPMDFSASSPVPPSSTQPSAKRPRALPLPSDDTDTAANVPEETPQAKKSKKNPVPLQNDASIIEIDDVDDLKSERLNKSDPTADIKEFFIALPPPPGQEKGRMQCKLCQYAVIF
jgi:hypothetical protein